MSAPRYAIGIDLGTTHCALSYVDIGASDGEHASQSVLRVPQLTAPGSVQELALLPSFLYTPHPSEFADGDLTLPWTAEQDFVAGELARSRGALTPIRLVSSAKSWLCHPGVDRRAAILPNDAPGRSRAFHRSRPQRDIWITYAAHGNTRSRTRHSSEQEIIVTIPASFDAAARELTSEAAHAAGYGAHDLAGGTTGRALRWIQSSDGRWRKQVKVGDIILVVDVGGGTTDFSLIAVVERDGNLELHRVAVGDHILLGRRQHGSGARLCRGAKTCRQRKAARSVAACARSRTAAAQPRKAC